MKRQWRRLLGLGCGVIAIGFGSVHTLRAATEVVLRNFAAPPKGANPDAGVFRDAAGNLYGTTSAGGQYGEGVVYVLSATGRTTVLYNFTGGADGANPQTGVILDASGNLYGTTYGGGVDNYGVVYKIDTAGNETVLHSFAGGLDGEGPSSGVVFDAEGNLFGTTSTGGISNQGVIYELPATGGITVLHSFTGGTDGSYPSSGIVLDPAGNLYGTTGGGGSGREGVVYKFNAAGQETILHSFGGGTDGASPSGLIRSSAGDLYGCTGFGGAGASGTLYKLSAAGTETVLYAFTGGLDGDVPQGNLVRDGAGNLYGTTLYGGGALGGVVYQLNSAGQESVLYSFPGESGGYYPGGSLTRDAAGNLYGTTNGGGGSGYGVVYEVSAAAQEAVLFTFPPATDGSSPSTGVILDAKGNLYGTTDIGGAAAAGTVYEVSAAGSEKVLYTFQGGADGANPHSGVVRDAGGNLYGTAEQGGLNGLGVVYKLSPAGEETILHNFAGGLDGRLPDSGVTLDAAGNLYGTSYYDGAYSKGLVYKLDVTGTETVLYNFTGGADGGFPMAGVILDAAGNLYGTTVSGGTGAGVVYRVDPSGHETVLLSFNGTTGGAAPQSGVTRDAAGNVYGTTTSGGASYAGVVYKVDPSGNETVLYNFTGHADGAYPSSGVVRDSAGNLYGTTEAGGAHTYGTVYSVSPAGTETVLYSFDITHGANPGGGVVRSPAGNLYGTASAGGTHANGVVFKVIP